MGVLTMIAYVIYVAAALLMVFAILLQEGRGGGLSALGGTQAESAFGATNPIRRMTVVLALLFFVLAGFLSYMGSRKRVTFEGEKSSTKAIPKKAGAKAPAEEERDRGSDVRAGGASDSEPAGTGVEAEAVDTDVVEDGGAAPAVPPEEAKPAEPGRADSGLVPTAPGRADSGPVPTAPGRAAPTAPGNSPREEE